VTSDTPPAERRAALRAATLHLVLGVVALDAVALLLYYGLDLAPGPNRTRTIFVAIWTFATAITVAFLLKRVRQARFITRPVNRR
jgi:type VI protein secretion system component VasK